MCGALLRASEWIVELPVTSTSVLLTDVLSEALAKGNGDTDKSSGPRLISTGVDCRNNSFLSRLGVEGVECGDPRPW